MSEAATAAPAVDAGQASDAAAVSAGAEVLGDSTANDNWIDIQSIEDPEMRAWVENKNFQDPLSALKSYREAEKLIGSNDRMAPPEEGKDLSEWGGWDKLGVPREAKAYAEAVKPPELPDGMQIDQALLDSAYEIAAAKRIPPQHLQEMVNLFAETQKAQFEAAQAQDKQDRAEVDSLYKEWGPAKAQNLEHARRFTKELGFSDSVISNLISETGSAEVIKAFATAGARLAEGGLISGGAPVLSREQVAAEMDAIKGNPDMVRAINDPSHTNHASAKKRWEELTAQKAQLVG